MNNKVVKLYETKFGESYVGNSLDLMKNMDDESVNLVITSPPFALLRKKEYGNKDQDKYVDWLLEFGYEVHRILKDTGSFVLDLGESYKKGRPVRSLYNYKVLIAMCEKCKFNLAEEFFWHNPSKLPSPIEWVNKRKIRVKDSVNTIWWFSKTDFPKADVKKVLKPYSKRMKKLLDSPENFYNPKDRPSGHNISKNFRKDNGGAIPPNMLQIPNSSSNSQYMRHCKHFGIKRHPARFPTKLPLFFINLLTGPDDTVFDIFAGSNTTGEVAEKKGRKWISCDTNREYAAASALRFFDEEIGSENEELFDDLLNSNDLPIEIPELRQMSLELDEGNYYG
jgi:site-specific DNA-methyltransferase (cytosine-N4-specific)